MPNKTEIRCFKRWLVIKEGAPSQILEETDKKKKVTAVAAEEVKEDMGPLSNANLSSQWTPIEDELLMKKVKEFGTQNWVIIARFLNGRLGRQCRERWHNVLNPEIVRREWTREEDEFIIKMQ